MALALLRTSSLCAVWLVVACSAEHEPDRLERAIEVIRDAAYISFDHAADGCHDRSILMTAELAAAGIPSNAVFLVPRAGVLRPQRFQELAWNYHVAPMIRLADDDSTDATKFWNIVDGSFDGAPPTDAYVIDPALYPNEIAASLTTWVDHMTSHHPDAFVVVADGRSALDVPRDETVGAQMARDSTWALTMDTMPKLYRFQPSSACSFLARDAGKLEGELGPDGVLAIRHALNTGVANLLAKLRAQALLLDVGPPPGDGCWDS